MLDSLHCPNCGAPIHPGPNQGLLICLYCNTSIRLQAQAGQPQATAEASLDADMMAQLKQLLLAGQQEQALRDPTRLIFYQPSGAS